jgi:hypothetical protein
MEEPDSSTRAAVEATLRAFVHHAVPGAKIYFPRGRDRRVRYSWNGRHLRPTGLTLESQCHEVAHVLVSAPDRRSLCEFGLGPDPYRNSNARRVVRDRIAEREEEAACTMQLVLVRLLGLNERAVVEEVAAVPLSEERVRALRRRYARALPADAWRRVLCGLKPTARA